MSSFVTPPLPTNDGGLGASDLVNAQGTSLTQDAQSALGLAENSAARIGNLLGSVWQNSHIMESVLALLTTVVGALVTGTAKVETFWLPQWINFEEQIYAAALPLLETAGGAEATSAINLLVKAMAGGTGSALTSGSGGTAAAAQTAFSALVQPFTLINSGLDPSVVGSGKHAQDYILQKAVAMSLQEWIVNQCGEHMGMAFFKSMGPFLSIIDRSINPSNIVRHAMNASLQFYLTAPLTRDMNHDYPIKDLGLTALAKLYIRGAIGEDVYTAKCLDSGLDAGWAQELAFESSKMLAPADVAKLVALGQMSQPDASAYLGHLGYLPSDVPAQLYIDGHERYFQIQERIGYKAVTAWQRGYIDENQLRQLLAQLGFTQDEINLLEIEGEFEKGAKAAGISVIAYGTVLKTLTYGQIKQLYDANIIGVGDVITYLENEGYSQTDTINLVLLEFTTEVERAARKNEMLARLRVQTAADVVAAAAATAKNETALAAAKTALAAELQTEADTLGTTQTAGGILAALKLI